MIGMIKIVLLSSGAVLVLSILGVLVIIFRKIPVLLSLPERPEIILPKTSWLKRIKKKIIELKEGNLKVRLLSFIEKEVRKFRLFFLKTDNFLDSLIKKLQGKAEIWRVKSRNFLAHQQAKRLERIKTLEKIEKEEPQLLIKEVENENIQNNKQDSGRDRTKTKQQLESKEKGNNQKSEKDEESELIRLIARNPQEGRYYYQLGIFYVRQKNFEDAKKCFQQVLKLDKENEEALRRLGEIKKLED